MSGQPEMQYIEPIYRGFLLWAGPTKQYILDLYNSQKLDVNIERDIQQQFQGLPVHLDWLTQPGKHKPSLQRNIDNSLTLTDLWAHPQASDKPQLMAAIYSDIIQENNQRTIKPNMLALGQHAMGVFFFNMTCCDTDDLSAVFVLPNGNGGYLYDVRHKNPQNIPANLRDMLQGENVVKVVDDGLLQHIHMHVTGIGHDCGTKQGFFKTDAKQPSSFTCTPA